MRWLLESVVAAIHSEQIAEHGGEDGLRDAGLLASALARPRHLENYERPSLCRLAAAYAYGLARNHPFLDGNKRTAFLAAYVFLRLNGRRLKADEAAAAAMTLALASGEIGEEDYAAWLEKDSVEECHA